MKAMKKRDKFTGKEWAELASLLSNEKGGNTDLLDRFLKGDAGNSGIMWKELNKMNDQEKIDVDKAWNKVHSRLVENGLQDQERTVRISFMSSTLLRIAAVALVLVGLGTSLLYMNNSGYLSKKVTITAGINQKNVLVSLSDGSKVYLNRNSEFSYREKFGIHRRNVKLRGEAFFEIAPDASKPFIIDAGKARVRVVGTSFNVITSNEASEVEVFVKTGKVLVTDNSGSQSLQLDPGYVGILNSKESSKTLNNNPNYLSWRNGYLDYSGQKLSVVFRDLKRVYNMDIIPDDPEILDNVWVSPIDNLPQETIVRLICGSFNLGYTKDGNVYHLWKK